MKVNKIICDVCEKEIDISSDESLAMFERIQVQQKISLIPNLRKTEMESDKEVVKTTYDLCKACSIELEEFLLKRKKEKSIKK